MEHSTKILQELCNNFQINKNCLNRRASEFNREIDQTKGKSNVNVIITGSTRIQITKYLLARGIDVEQVVFVFNYELPFKKEKISSE